MNGTLSCLRALYVKIFPLRSTKPFFWSPEDSLFLEELFHYSNTIRRELMWKIFSRSKLSKSIKIARKVFFKLEVIEAEVIFFYINEFHSLLRIWFCGCRQVESSSLLCNFQSPLNTNFIVTSFVFGKNQLGVARWSMVVADIYSPFFLR